MLEEEIYMNLASVNERPYLLNRFLQMENYGQAEKVENIAYALVINKPYNKTSSQKKARPGGLITYDFNYNAP
jgi:hypothetical protein